MIIVAIAGLGISAVLMAFFIIQYLRKRSSSQSDDTQVNLPTDRIIVSAQSPMSMGARVAVDASGALRADSDSSESYPNDDVMVIETSDVSLGMSEDEIMNPLEATIAKWTGRLDVEPATMNGSSAYQIGVDECIDDLLVAMDKIRNKIIRSEG